MFENSRRGRQARNFTTNVPKILDLKSSSEQIFSENCRWVLLNEDVRAQKDALENLNTQENIKKDSNRYFAEKVWKIPNFISLI